MRYLRVHREATVATGTRSAAVVTVRVVAGAAAGLVAGFFAGVLVLQLAARFSTTGSGMEDLQAVAASFVSFAPIGALIGGVLAAGRPLRIRWQGRPDQQRRATWIGLAAGPLIGMLVALNSSDPVEAIAGGVMAMPLGAAIGFALGGLAGRIRANARPSDEM